MSTELCFTNIIGHMVADAHARINAHIAVSAARANYEQKAHNLQYAILHGFSEHYRHVASFLEEKALFELQYACKTLTAVDQTQAKTA